MTPSLSHHEALIYVMVITSAADRMMSDKEVARIGRLTGFLPVFARFDQDNLIHISRECANLVAGPEGLDIALELIREALPERLYETAYALAVEIVSADLSIKPEEIRMLQLLRDRLSLDKLICAAIERSAMARYRA